MTSDSPDPTHRHPDQHPGRHSAPVEQPAGQHPHEHVGADGSGHDACGCQSAEGAAPGPLADASVRRARPNDAPAVGLVQLQSMRTDYAPVLPAAALDALAQLSEAEVATAWRQALEQPPTARHRLLVACSGAQVVGLASFGPSEDPDGDDETADLASLVVHPRARGQGHGSRLLNAVVDESRAAGFTWLTTWVPLDAPALRGFVQAAGMGPDRARRERVVDASGTTVTEVRLGASLSADPDPSAP